MNELEQFRLFWDAEFYGQGSRGDQKRKKYESMLFSIWKNHSDHDIEGFQVSIREDRTLARVRRMAEDAGLLIMTRDYSVDNHTRMYHKNHKLFDMVFRDKDNKYKKWLDSQKSVEDDIVNKICIDEVSSIDIDKLSYVDTTSKRKKKFTKLNYDIEKLYSLSRDLFKRYYDYLILMNDNSKHFDLMFKTFIHFDKKGLPSGRPWSYFCSTLNPKKAHIDNSIETRPDFLNRVGLGDYHEVYDIKSEVPRVNHLFHTGEWKDDSYDFYNEIIEDTGMKEYVGEVITRGQTKYADYNDSMKQLFMRIYFGRGSDLQSFNGYVKERKSRLDNINKYIEWYDRDLSELDIYNLKLQNGEDLTYQVWKEICNSTRKACGQSIGNLIFWYTFMLETELKIELLKRGKVVYNVYDGFYYNQDIKEEIKELLIEKSKFVYENYMRVIKL